MREHRQDPPIDLIGRGDVLNQLEGLLREKRLVTVTGPGGVGKSALAAALAERMRSVRAHGTSRVPECSRHEPLEPCPEWAAVGTTDLSSLGDPDHVPDRLARALRLDPDPGRPRLAALAEAVGRQPMLLVVDTCEHLSEVCSDALSTLIERCPGLHVLATSRAPLETPGVYPLGPFPLDDATRLFTDSARRFGSACRDDPQGAADAAAGPGSGRGPGSGSGSGAGSGQDPGYDPVPDPETAQRICALLDSLPLALRIAAGQLGHCSSEDLLSCLSQSENALDLTAPSPSDLPKRQRTLRHSLQWSLQLCTPEERLLLARASVFPGAFSLKDALHVCTDERLLPGPLTAAFTGLTRQALVLPERERRPEPQPELKLEPVSGPGHGPAMAGHNTPYRMPRVTRAYGRQWLAQLGEDREFLRRCVNWSLGTT